MTASRDLSQVPMTIWSSLLPWQSLWPALAPSPDPAHVHAQFDEVVRMLSPQFPDVAAMLGDAKEDLLAFTAFPQAHWRKIWSTNPLERLNKEIKRRARVVGIFPNDASVIRLVGMILTDTNDEWITDERRYLSEGSMALLFPERNNQNVPAITGSDL